jgi:hypothetical protein
MRALLENMRFSAFVIASVFVSYVGYGLRHGMDDDKEEPGWSGLVAETPSAPVQLRKYGFVQK